MSERPAIASRAAAVFGLDVRSLAAFRVALGGVLLVDLVIRAADFRAMYTDAGFAPVDFVRQFQQCGQWSLHLLSDAPAWQAALFVAAATFAMAIAVGYHTRLATVVSWVLLASLQMRQPYVNNAGDSLLRLLLFWSMFLPLGNVWSLDARRRGASGASRVVSAATFAFIVQLSLVYLFAGVAKWNDAWLDGNALAEIFGFGLYSLPVGRWLLAYPEVTRLLSRATLFLEFLGPLLLFSPWATARCRTAALAIFLPFHVGIALTITVGLFSYVAMIAWMAIVPAEFWDRIALTVRRETAGEREARLRPIASALCLAALALVVYWNMRRRIPWQPPAAAQAAIACTMNATTLRQAWGVFPRPPAQDCWFVYHARLQNGEIIDLLTGRPALSYERPASSSAEYPNHRWRKLHLHLLKPAVAPYRQALAEYYARQWNEAHDDDEQAVQVDFYCYRQAFGATGESDRISRIKLAEVVHGNQAGNFAEAVRELGP